MQQLWHTNVVKGIKLGHDGGIKIHDMTPLTLAAEIRQSHQSKHSVSLHSERTYKTGLIATRARKAAKWAEQQHFAPGFQ